MSEKHRDESGVWQPVEALAEHAHDNQWSGWMKYLFSKCSEGTATLDDFSRVPNGTLVIPAWAVERWTRQMSTPYADLPPEEKESDRKEARAILGILNEGWHTADYRGRK